MNGNDAAILTDFLLDRLDDADAQAVRARLAGDEAFRRAHDDLVRTFAALDRLPEPDPPEDLVEKTLARIAAARAGKCKTDALIARQQMLARGAYRPTFALRELAAVAAVILVVAGVLIPSLRLARRRAQAGQCASRMGQLGSALQTYAIDHQGFLPNAPNAPDASNVPITSGPGVGAPRWLAATGQPPVSNSTALIRLVPAGYAHSASLLLCPAHGEASFPHRISFSYHYSLGETTLSIYDPALKRLGPQMVILADRTPLFREGRFQRERADPGAVSDNHRTGQNVLSLSGAVRWTRNAAVGVDGDHIFLVGNLLDYRGDEKPSTPTDTFLLPTGSE